MYNDYEPEKVNKAKENWSPGITAWDGPALMPPEDTESGKKFMKDNNLTIDEFRRVYNSY